MKKIIALMLSLMVVFAFTACGGSEETAGAAESSTGSAEQTASESDDEAEFEEVVLFDNDQCTMVVKDFDEDGDWGPALKVYLENKTSDETLMFAVESASVNGYMLDPFFATEVSPGKKENTEITWLEEDLADNDIEKIEDIELSISVYDAEDWEQDYYVEDTFTVTIPQ